MATTAQRLEELRKQLRELVREIGTAEPDLGRLDRLISGAGATNNFQDFKRAADFVRELLKATKELGGQGSADVKVLGRELLELEATAARLAGVSAQRIFGGLRGLGGFVGGGAALGVKVAAEQKIANVIKEQVQLRRQAGDVAARLFNVTERQIGAEREKSKVIQEWLTKLAAGESLAGQNVARAGASFRRGQQGALDPNRFSLGRFARAGRGASGGFDTRAVAGGAQGLSNFNAEIERLGARGGRVVGIFEEMRNGIRRFSIEQRQANGVVRRGEVVMDRFGNVLKSQGRGFRTFTESIGRNLTKVLEWTIAISLTYAPIRLLGALMETLRDTQESLAEATVIVGRETAKTANIFQSAAEIAQLTGVEIKGAIEGYSLAFAATGSIESSAERAATANILLRDSMVFAKLAGIDQAQALDTLVAAIAQTGRELTEGIQIVDAFVAVSRQSNVSINTLASVFAIVGTAAADAGIEFAELNAIAATLAESTKLSADETGNAIRGFISGFQTSQSEEVLGRFGIAVRNAKGEIRDFTDLLFQLSRLSEAGILDQDALREITNAIGGGFRRGAQFATLLEETPRVLEIIAVQANSGGQAFDALNIRTETLETAITKLGNAFTELSISLGGDGGLLFIFTEIVDGGRIFISIMAELTSTLGIATTAMLAFGAASAALRFSSTAQGLAAGAAPAFLQRAAGGLPALGGATSIAARIAGQAGGRAPQSILGGLQGAYGRGGQALGRVPFVGGALQRAGPLAVGVTALAAGQNLLQGDTEEAGGNIAGAILGGLITGGNPVGVAIGAAAGGAFVAAITGPHGQDLINGLAKIEAAARDQAAEEAGITDFDRTLQNFSGSASIFDEFQAGFQSFFAGLASDIKPGAFGPGFADLNFGERQAQFLQGTATGTGSSAFDFLGGGPLSFLPTSQSLTEAGAAFVEGLAEEKENIGQILAGTPAEQLADKIREKAGPIGESIAEAHFRATLLQFQRGQASLQEVQQARNARAGGGELLTTVATLFEQAGQPIDDIENLGRQLVLLDATERNFVNQLIQTVIDEQKALQSGEEGSSEENVASAVGDFIDFTQRALLSAGVGEIDILKVVGLGEVSSEEANAIIDRAEELQRLYFEQFTDDPEQIQELIDRLSSNLITIGDGAAAQYLDRRTFAGAGFLRSAAEEAGAGTEVSRSLIDLRDQLGVAEWPRLLQRIEQVEASVSENFPAFFKTLDLESEQNIILTDGFRTAHTDRTILNLAMGDLIELNEQQLEGIFNIPEGVTAFIPFTGALGFGVGGSPSGEEGFGRAVDVFDGAVHRFTDGMVSPENSLTAQEQFDANTAAALSDPELNRLVVKIVPLTEEQRGEQERQAIKDQIDAIQHLIDIIPDLNRTREFRLANPELKGLPLEKIIEILDQQQASAALQAEAAKGADLFSGIGAIGDLPGVLQGFIESPLTQGILQNLQDLLPSSIPISADFDITLQNMIHLDSKLIGEALETKQFKQFKDATRRSGAVGYEAV